LRRFLVKQFALECGKRVRVKHNADVSPSIKVGDYSELGTNSRIQAGAQLGRYVIMGPDVKIYCRNHIFEDCDTPIALQGKVTKTTIVGDDVWIGANVVLVAGVNIGSHSVIAAGAVVTKDVPEYSVVGGNPAKVLRDRREARK